jgi:hypothetical protein
MPFHSTTTPQFRALLAALPREVQAQAAQAFRQFLTDPFDHSLQLKRLRGSQTVYSARIGSHYRALAERAGNHFRWFWIGSHADYDRVIRRIP